MNAAVARFRRAGGDEREHRARRLYLRHLPLVRKVLAGFCYRSRCYAGACHVEELVGESYAVFREALERYDPSFKVDFVGFVSRRLLWRLRSRLDRLEEWWSASSLSLDARLPPPTTSAELGSDEGSQERGVLARVLRDELLERLDEGEADLLVRRYERGYTSREIAEEIDVSHAAVRKRLERIRTRLRERA
ncbi:MAG: sigma-70 family RNA polymerase sigma factor [Gemmatimonadetes bacterium]|nr:sigma-70 family RNA polymerase sigma factor [Gemmatimonadota bacterium]NIR77529.1 sigma-70 family RNA polymerase sigma factor [Gemmatimonadota bacterium]NIT86066.1 sigma-70 family RNA polymerase sigma factor [Gemmatimonadota bacterium]NIU29893.1 sigma-70 family RNA polymerase sigma factor [Gemmatimonadota bacterium]NIU34887.1 sigma-70 family RNA polymerase sigma factor [Gemmatimonadota bacterium]